MITRTKLGDMILEKCQELLAWKTEPETTLLWLRTQPDPELDGLRPDFHLRAILKFILEDYERGYMKWSELQRRLRQLVAVETGALAPSSAQKYVGNKQQNRTDDLDHDLEVKLP